MSRFSLTLEDRSPVDGLLFTPQHQPLPAISGRKPLLVVVPGGTYTADFFDADAKHSLRSVCNCLGVPALALNRAGYGSTPPPSIVDQKENSFIQQSGRWLNTLALPAIWTKYATTLDISSIVLYGHSIGAAVCLVSAAEYAKHKYTTPYHLAGLMLSGIGCKNPENSFDVILQEEYKANRPMPLKQIGFPSDQQVQYMLGSSPQLYQPTIVQQIVRLRNDIYIQELLDIEFLWRDYWKSYASLITVPVLYNPGLLDRLWIINQETVDDFRKGFTKSTGVSVIVSPNAPHAIELSHQSTGFYIKMVGFAVECAAQLEIALAMDKSLL